jgi:hypothetical protein
MRHLLIGTIVLFLVVPRLWAQEKDKEKLPESTTAKQQYDALAKEYQNAVEDFQKSYQAAKTAEERQKAAQQLPKREVFATRMLKVAEDHPKDAAAVDALIWIVINAGYTSEGTKALEIIADHHVKSEKLGALYLSLVYSQAASAEKLLRSIIKENPNREVSGKASFSLARRLSEQGDASKDKEADRLFEVVEKNYADIPYFRPGTTLGEVAKQARQLLIGKEAPEIEGEDIDGQKLKLSDYRGKVVVLDFWGHW